MHDLDRAVEVLARRQHATVARRQLDALGVAGHRVDHLVKRGWLRLVHRGVYAAGPGALTIKGRWMAAVLAAGPHAVVSHRSAAVLWRVGPSEGRDVDVTLDRWRRPRAGIAMHQAHLAADEETTVDGIPVTTVARTLLDLAAMLPPHRLERAIHEAERRRLWDATGLRTLIARYPRRPGTPALKTILTDHMTITKTELERLLMIFLKHSGFSRPHANRLVDTAVRTYECDFVWPEARLIVELDGYESHGTRRQFEEDRARDRALTIAGWRVIRITWRQLRDDPQTLAKDLRALLGRGWARVA